MYGPTRTRATWKPRVGEGDLAFFETDDGVLALGLHGARSGRYDGTDRSNVFSPDYLLIDGKETMEFAETAPDVERFHIGFDIVGGFENNAIRVFWPDDEHPRWIALKTFTGFQVKYPQPGKRPPVVFALADEDAYCYCNETPCRRCSFNCKSGFILYALYEGAGIVRVPIERASND